MLSKILSIVGGAVVGYALLHKQDKQSIDDKVQALIDKEKELEEREAEVTAREEEQIASEVVVENLPTRKVDKKMYMYDKGKSYDPFYDYTDAIQDSQTQINADVLNAPEKVLRARIIPEETFISYSDGSTINGKWGRIWVNGRFVNMKTCVEVFNPSDYPISISKCKVDGFTLNNRKLTRFIMQSDDTDYRSRRGEYITRAIERGSCSKNLSMYIIDFPNEDVSTITIAPHASWFIWFTIDNMLNDIDIENTELWITDKYEYRYKINTTDYTANYPTGGLSFRLLIHNDSHNDDFFGALPVALYQSQRPKAVENLGNQWQKQYLGNLFGNQFTPKEKWLDELEAELSGTRFYEVKDKYFKKDILGQNYYNVLKTQQILNKLTEYFPVIDKYNNSDLGKSKPINTLNDLWHNTILKPITQRIALIRVSINNGKWGELSDSDKLLWYAYQFKDITGTEEEAWEWYQDAVNDALSAPDSYQFWCEDDVDNNEGIL